MGTTPIYGIRYPDPTTRANQLPQSFQNLALDTEGALAAAEIPPVSVVPAYVAPSAAARDAFWGVPATAAEQVTLQNRGATTVRTDRGWTEQYFALYNASTNPGGVSAPGWYPVGGLVPSLLARQNGSQGTLPANAYTLINAAWGTFTGAQQAGGWTLAAGAFTVPVTGIYDIQTAVRFPAASNPIAVQVLRNSVTPDTDFVARLVYTVTGASEVQAANRTRLTAGDLLRVYVFTITAQAINAGGDSVHLNCQYDSPPWGP